MSRGDDPSISPEEMTQIRDEALEFSGIGLYRYRFDGTVVFMDRGAMRLLDLEEMFPDPEELIGKPIGDLIVYEGPIGFLRSEIRKKGHVRDLQYPFRTLTGKMRWALHDSFLTKDTETGEELIQVIIRDITALRTAEEALHAERERLAVTLRSIGDGVISTDVESRIILLNREAERLTGWTQEEALGRQLEEVFHIINERTREIVANPVAKVMEKGRVVGLANHTILISRDGTERAIADSGAPVFDSESSIVGAVLVFRDAENERLAEATRLRVDKLESLGILAGGIAHDFNNYLTSILGNISLARIRLERSDGDDSILDMLREAEDSSVRGRSLTDQLLTFAKGGIPVKSVVMMDELIKRCTAFALSGSPVKLLLSLAPDLFPVEADEGQLGRVIENLTINAKQAMPDGGTLKVSADNVDLEMGNPAQLPAGSYIRLVLADDGIGIDRRHLTRIFDPYFTTKQMGSGLGLASVHSIVSRHDGTILVKSSPGAGTTFTVFLPACETAVTDVKQTPGEFASSGGRVLVMDDQQSVLRTAARMLKMLGFTPVCVENGTQAVATCRQAVDSGTPFDVVILDLTVPGGMGGVETLNTLKKFWPEVRAIASSGYSTDAVMSNHSAYGFQGVVRKPYTISELGERLNGVLR